MNILLPLLLCLLSPASAVHDRSTSTSVIHVDGARVDVQLRCQTASLFEVIQGLDVDGDQLVSAAELSASEERIGEYVNAHYRLRLGSDPEGLGGDILEPSSTSLFLVKPGASDGETSEGRSAVNTAFQWVELRMVYNADEELQDLALDMTLFMETSPRHNDIITMRWGTNKPTWVLLDRGIPTWRWVPQGAGQTLPFLREGWNHILSGWDHLCFLLALLFSVRRVRSIIGVVTAFTVAHSITLAAVSLGLVNVGGYGGFIEAAIALSIAYVAVDNLLHEERSSSRWPEAFIFGLVHGLGFAGFLSESLIMAESQPMALLCFNLGVEAGQLLFVVLLSLVMLRLPRKPDETHLVPRGLRRGGSVLVAIAGLYWFVERAWFS